MHIIHIHNLTVNLAGYEVFHDLSWVIGDHDRVGFVGPNGAGKSTLLKAIAGIITPDKGTIAGIGAVTIGYLPQEVVLEGDTLIEAAMQPSPELACVEAELSAVESQMERPEVYNDADALTLALEQQAELVDLYERLGGTRHESLVRELLARLGFTPGDYDLPTTALSGGQKKLVALTRLAAWSPTVLLLDEPDNHLDISAKHYLEEFIKSYHGSVVIVSHDRYLLDEVATHIAELDAGKITAYVGNYSAYALERDLRRLRQQQMYVAQQKVIQRIEARIHEWDLMAKADNERAARQAASRRKMLARMEANGEMIERVRERRYMELELEGSRGSTKAVEFIKVAMGFDDDLLFMDANMLVRHGERVGLVGANGAGKSVLFKLILGQLEPIDGIVKVGPSTRVGYYAQEHQTLASWGSKTPLELVRDVKTMPEATAVNMLLKFTFTYDQVRQPIATFSGGERSRLQLLTLMLQAPNLLLLDEPTNNLDIGSSEVLENALDEFEGAVLVISHDRYFLDRVVDRVVELENGTLTDYEGGYTDYVDEKARRLAAKQRQMAQKVKKRA